MSTTTQIESLILMYKTWDYRHIEGHLSDDVTYSSAWVLLPIEGKGSFIDFIKGKLRTMKLAHDSGRLNLNVTKLSGESNDLLKLSYSTSITQKEILIRVTFSHSLIISIELLPL